jgi:hypothetical protein
MVKRQEGSKNVEHQKHHRIRSVGLLITRASVDVFEQFDKIESKCFERASALSFWTMGKSVVCLENLGSGNRRHATWETCKRRFDSGTESTITRVRIST